MLREDLRSASYMRICLIVPVRHSNISFENDDDIDLSPNKDNIVLIVSGEFQESPGAQEAPLSHKQLGRHC
jgi:hypothetical protein